MVCRSISELSRRRSGRSGVASLCHLDARSHGTRLFRRRADREAGAAEQLHGRQDKRVAETQSLRDLLAARGVEGADTYLSPFDAQERTCAANDAGRGSFSSGDLRAQF